MRRRPRGGGATIGASTVRDDDSAPTVSIATGAAPRQVPSSVRRDDVAAAALGRGDSVGRYLVLEVIGSGGMGVVYAAFDPKLDRRIALKLLRPAAEPESSEAGSRARSRLVREAQALAKLSHPNVVAIYDVGTHDDSVFLAMEHIDGLPLDHWLEAKTPSVDSRLDVLLQAGRGLAAAHAAGLIHRDLKPSNILVGGDGRARVIDLGLVRALDGPTGQAPAAGPSRDEMPPDEPTDVSSPDDKPFVEITGEASDAPLTRHGSVVGTPRYMAPEQHLGVALDARGDQFSFCLVAYESLFEQRPFSGRRAHYIRNLITGPPVPPPRRSPVPRRAREAILRGLSRDPDDRFSSMDELIAALEPPRRRRWPFAAAAVVATAAATAMFVSTESEKAPVCQSGSTRAASVWNPPARRAVESAFAAGNTPFATSSFRAASGQLDQWAAAWSQMYDDTCAATRVRAEQSEALLDLRMACLDRSLQRVNALVSVFRGRPEPGVVQRSADAVARVRGLADCANTRALLGAAAPPPAHAQRAVKAVRDRLDHVGALAAAGLYRDGRREHPAIIDAARRTNYLPVLVEALVLAGRESHRAGDGQAAREYLLEATEVGPVAKDDERTAQAWALLAQVTSDLDGEHERGLVLARAARGFLLRAGEPALALAELGDKEGRMLYELGRPDEAREAYENALALREKTLGPDDPRLAEPLGMLGVLATTMGDARAGERSLLRAIELKERLVGSKHPELAPLLGNLASAYHSQKRYADSVALHRRVLAIEERAFGTNHPEVSITLGNLGNALESLERFDEAMELQRRALAIDRKALGSDHPSIAYSLTSIGRIHAARGETRQALELYREALDLRERRLGERHPLVAYTLTVMGQTLVEQGRYAEAIETLERSIAIRIEVKDPTGYPTTRFALARALAGRGMKAKAKAIAEEAAVALRAQAPDGAAELAELESWLASQ